MNIITRLKGLLTTKEELPFIQRPEEFTPDMYRLEQAPQHLVFECGPVLYNVPYICSAFTVERMSLWRKAHENDAPAQAVPLRMDGAPRARIRGTLYVMSTEMILKLDKRRENGVSFERTQVPIVLPVFNKLQEPKKLPKPVWMYKAIKESWVERIEYDQGVRGWTDKRAHPAEKTFELAGVYPDNHKFLHNHFGYNGLSIEAHNMPGMIGCRNTEAFIEHCEYKNYREIERILGK